MHYALACRGEVGIAGMPPEEAGPLREGEQRRSAAIVGVEDVQFWDFPDSNIRDTPELRAKIADTITELAPDIVITHLQRTGVGARCAQPARPHRVLQRRCGGV